MTRRFVRFIVLGLSALALTAGPAHAQISLTKAKELYSSAAYDDALAMLNNLMSAAPSGESAPSISQSDDGATASMYRVLCLVALGRAGEVDSAVERLVSQYPLYRPPADELSPRIRTVVTNTRVRVLPSMIQRRYAESKAAYDRGDFASASVGFKWVLGALTDPDISHVVGQSPLADLRTLSTGFADLSERALNPPPPPVAPTPRAVAAPPTPAAPAKDYKRLFTQGDADVVAPVTVRQSMPRFPGPITEAAAGVLEIVIDATGSVESVRMLESVHPVYDQLVVAAAKKWQYQPARLDGVPVRFSKRIQVSLTAGR